jgi:hypothetical protein
MKCVVWWAFVLMFYVDVILLMLLLMRRDDSGKDILTFYPPCALDNPTSNATIGIKTTTSHDGMDWTVVLHRPGSGSIDAKVWYTYIGGICLKGSEFVNMVDIQLKGGL